jgi:hypothetical protein
MHRGHAVVLTIALASAPLAARAQSSVDADSLKHQFEEAVEIEKRGEYEKALERFRKIEAVKPTAGVLFHEAYCLELLGKLAAAFNAYEVAEKVARVQKKTEVVNAVQSRLGPLGQRVPLVNVTVEPKDADVRIDGQLVTNMSVRVDAGEHALVAQAPGRAPKKLTLTCREGSVQSIALTLEPAPAPAQRTDPHPAPPSSPPPVTEPPDEEPRRQTLALPLAVTAGSVAFVAGGVVSFLLAGSAQSDAKGTCPTKPSCDDERDHVRTLDTLALTGFVLGAGLGALAGVLWTGRSSGSAKVTAAGSALLLRGEF